MKRYCALCFKLIPKKDIEEDGSAYCSCGGVWYCCEDCYYNSKDEDGYYD